MEAETCCLIDYTVVICETVLSQNTYNSLVVCHYIRLYNQKKHHTDWEEQGISKDKKGLILKLLKQVRQHVICSCKLYVPLTQLSALSYSLNLLYFHWMYTNKCNICYQEYFKHDCIYNVTFLLIPWTLHQLLCFKETLEMPHLPGPHD